jgi:DNA-binding IclR family transcriptional regulator
MAKWSFLTNHARVLICIAHDPGVRLREIAAALDITERSAFGIVTELTKAGYVVKEKDGRRNRYEIQAHLPLRGTIGRERTVGEVLDVLVEASAHRPHPPTHEPGARHATPAPAWRRWRPRATA